MAKEKPFFYGQICGNIDHISLEISIVSSKKEGGIQSKFSEKEIPKLNILAKEIFSKAKLIIKNNNHNIKKRKK